MVAKAFIFAERIGHGCQRQLHIFLQLFWVRHVAWHLAHAVQIIRKTDQTGRNIGDHFERAAHHCCAAHLTEGANMGQTGRAIPRFKKHVIFAGFLNPFEQRARLYKRPSLGRHARIAQVAHVFSRYILPRPPWCGMSRVLLQWGCVVNK